MVRPNSKQGIADPTQSIPTAMRLIAAYPWSKQFCKRLVHYRRCPLDIGGCVSCGNESGFKLRWREINAALQTGMEKSSEHFQVASLSASKIDNWTRGKEHTKHRAEAMKRDVDLHLSAMRRIRCGELNRFPRKLFKLCAQFFEQFPAVDPLELS